MKKIEKINQTATKIELATLGAGAVIFGLAAMSPSDSAYRQAVNKGMAFVFGNKQILKSQVKDFTANHLDPRNITITDADGNVLKKYRNKVSVRNVYNELPSGG